MWGSITVLLQQIIPMNQSDIDKGFVRYKEVAELPLGELKALLEGMQGLEIGGLKVRDLVVWEGALDNGYFTRWEDDVFGAGCYVVKHEGKVAYVGKAGNLLKRLQSHRNFDKRDWNGFNAMARLYAEHVQGNRGLAEGHAATWETFNSLWVGGLNQCTLVRVVMDWNTDKRGLGKLERVLLKLLKPLWNAPKGDVNLALTLREAVAA